MDFMRMHEQRLASDSEYRAQSDRLLAKLEPSYLRAALQFTTLCQIVHEHIKYYVLDRVRDFYELPFGEAGAAEFQRRVIEPARALQGSPKRVDTFKACLSWLVDGEAITTEQAERLDDIYEYRHRLTHGFLAFLANPDTTLDAGLFGDAVTILRDLNRFWVQMEADMGTFEDFGPDLDLDEVVSPALSLLQMCIDAMAETPLGSGDDSA